MLRVLQIAPVIFSRPNGPTIVLEHLLASLEQMGVQITILSSVRTGGENDEWHYSGGLKKWLLETDGSLKGFRNGLKSLLPQVDVVHIHGIWSYKYALISKPLRRMNMKYVITPHGQLVKESINHSRIKKKIAIYTILRPLLMNTRAIHVFSSSEHQRMIRWHSSQAKIYHIPNGIDLNLKIAENTELERELIKERNNCKRIFCYAGRLDMNHKGLDLLADAIAPIKDELQKKGIKIWLIGNYLSHKEKRVLENKFSRISDIIVQWGQRSLTEKNLIVSYADVFIHTSRYEGMPLAVLEAMQLGLPVLVTHGTNMEKIIKESSGGWIVDNDIESIKKIFFELTNLDLKLLLNIGSNAKNYVHKFLTWRHISNKIYNMYNDLIELH